MPRKHSRRTTKKFEGFTNFVSELSLELIGEVTSNEVRNTSEKEIVKKKRAKSYQQVTRNKSFITLSNREINSRMTEEQKSFLLNPNILKKESQIDFQNAKRHSNMVKDVTERKNALIKKLQFHSENKIPVECHYCNCKFTDISKITLDHVIPSSEYKGAKYDLNNLVLSCEVCNYDKGNMSYELYKKYRDIPLLSLLQNIEELSIAFFDIPIVNVFPPSFFSNPPRWIFYNEKFTENYIHKTEPRYDEFLSYYQKYEKEYWHENANETWRESEKE